MKQSKLESAVEQFFNIGSGLLVAFVAWKFVVTPAIESGLITIHDTLIITGFFTIISVFRGYFWRRFFENDLHLLVHQVLRKFY